MDDLKMIRELGRDLENDPPASLVRQRERMYGQRRGGLSRRRNWLVLGVAAAVTASALLVPRLLLSSGTDTPNVLDGVVPAEDARLTKNMNILVLGSDDRPGRGGEERGARSDTVIVAHVPASGAGMKMVSIPRDLLVDVPDCEDRSGGTVPGSRQIIGAAFTIGGADCTRRTVEQLSGLTLDHTVVFDFEAFRKAVDAVGGVEINIKADVRDPKAQLRLSKGRQTLHGEQALAYARARYGFGNGSDLGRIKRQQKVMAAVIKKLNPRLSDLPKLMKLVDELIPLLSADERLTPKVALQLANTVARSPDRKVAFTTLPVTEAPTDPNHLIPKQPRADTLWQTLR